MKRQALVILLCITCLTTSAQVAYYPDLSSQNFDGVRIYDNDSTFSLNFRFRMQNRVAFTFDDELNLRTSELMIRRLRLRLNGFVYSKKLVYAIQLGFSRSDMDWDNSGVPNIIRDAMITYKPNKHFMIGIGQTKLPGNRERLVSSGELQLPDRSNANAKFTLDRDAGVQAQYENKLGKTVYIISGAITSGKGRNWNTNNNGLAYTGKVEWLPFGQFSMKGNYFEGDWVREPKPRLSLSAAWSYSDNALRSGVQLGELLYAPRDVQGGFADLMFKYRGWALMAEYMQRTCTDPVTPSPVPSTPPRWVYTGQGVNVQLSYQFRNHYEIVTRYCNVNPSAPVNQYEVNQSDYGIGVNKYLQWHRVKLQTDLTYFTRRMEVTGVETAGWTWRFQFELGI